MNRVSALAINAADHLVSKGRLDAAASILRNYLSANSPRPEILQRLGRILIAQGRTAEAIPLLESALNQFSQPDDPASSDDTSDATADADAIVQIPTGEVPQLTMDADIT